MWILAEIYPLCSVCGLILPVKQMENFILPFWENIVNCSSRESYTVSMFPTSVPGTAGGLDSYFLSLCNFPYFVCRAFPESFKCHLLRNIAHKEYALNWATGRARCHWYWLVWCSKCVGGRAWSPSSPWIAAVWPAPSNAMDRKRQGHSFALGALMWLYIKVSVSWQRLDFWNFA